MKVNVFFLGTVDGRVLKVSSLDSSVIISEWKLGSESINEIKIRPAMSLFASTDYSLYQVDLRPQCSRYSVCSLCMNDPYCGWNIKKNTCETLKSNANLVTLNQNLCSRLQRQENVKSVQLESGSFALLECSVNDEYLFEFVEWRKGQEVIDFTKLNGSNMFQTWSKDLIIMSGNSSLNGIYNCYIDKNELISSYHLTYKSVDKTSLTGTSPNQSKQIIFK